MEYIKLKKVIINNDQVTFTSDHTCYANEFRVKSLNVEDLLKRFSLLTKLLKANGTSVSHKYKTRKFIADNVAEYDQAIREYNHSFDCMKKLAVKITNQPLPVGTIDNKDLNSMYGYRNLCSSLLNRSSIISKVLEFEDRIISLYQDLEDDDCNYNKVTF